ncbi:malolactic regulator [Liquorilactobacillus sucicola DSM 21376 = JCM 15457]|uniref:Malolactic regulator n=1 Tax=Liquorilactobacillus sucicola DSM 21376 = JCM 15457 TaxID=1423806 RepID=A0A0R2DUN7_9LACO|nr:malolactic regulator [Liquorilactobacillus sucicola DSM 21376 = JCM 15457]
MKGRMGLNTRDLAYFHDLVELKNYTEVANKFSVSQPTITVAIKRLENEFGAQLIKRDYIHNRLVVTRAGVLLFQRAQQILQSLDLAYSEVQNADSSMIRFGLPPIIGTMWFPLIAQELLNKGLLSHIQSIEAGSDQLLEKLKQGKIDVALLGSIRPLQEKKLDTFLLAVHPFRVVVSRKHSLVSKKHISFAELKGERFVTFTNNFVHPQALASYSKYAGFRPQIAFSTPTLSLIKELVNADLGISLLVDDAVKPQDHLCCLELDDPLPERFNMSLVVRKNFLPNKIQKEFISILFELKGLIETKDC